MKYYLERGEVDWWLLDKPLADMHQTLRVHVSSLLYYDKIRIGVRVIYNQLSL